MDSSKEMSAVQKWIRFRVGEGLYALPVSDVKGVVSAAAEKISPMPLGQSKNIFGLFLFRGEVAAIAKVEGLFKPQYLSATELTLLIVTSGNRTFAIPVDEVLGLTDVLDALDAKLLCTGTLYTGRLE